MASSGQRQPALGAAFLEGVLRAHRGDVALMVAGVEVGAGSGPGDNYMSTVYSCSVSGRTGAGEGFVERLVVKLCPEDASRRRLFRCEAAFAREASAYHDVLPLLGAPPAALFPDCLHASPDGVVVLRDLRPAGFRMADRRLGLDLPHAELAVRKLAQFHAQTLIVKRTSPHTAERLRQLLQPDLTFGSAGRQLTSESLANSFRMAAECLGDSSRQDESLRAALDGVTALSERGGLYGRLRDLLRDVDEATAVVCHGDANVNNLLFRHDAAGRPSDLRFLDLQVLRFASAATDVMYLLFTALQAVVLERHLLDLVATYHQQLQAEAKGAADHISLDHLLSEMRRHALWGLLMGFWVMPAMMISPQKVPSLEGSEALSQERLGEWTRHLGPDFQLRIQSILRTYVTLLRQEPTE